MKEEWLYLRYLDLLERTDTGNELIARYGVKFGIYKNNVFKEQLFPFDAIPRIIEKEEFAYLEKGLHCRPLAVLFCLFCILASLGMGNMAQANSIASGLQDAFGISPWMTGCFFVILISLVILGGIQRISRVAEFFVPAAALAYILCGILVILKNHAALLQALALIFREAFAPSSAAAGALGLSLIHI